MKKLNRIVATYTLVISLIFSFQHCSWTSNKGDKKNLDFHQWASTPPMGWNSWDCFGPTVVEEEVLANADYMAKHLKEFGWEYVVVDIRWYVGNDKAHGYNQDDPDYVIDEFGRFMPAVNRFPSAEGGKGFKPLADKIHAKGLKFGIHIMRGIPVIAVEQNKPIKGTNLTASDIYSKEDQCLWLRDMYTIVPGKPGSQEYYNSLFELYASWGLDFIKIDDLSSPIYFAEEIEMIRKAIDSTGRKIVLSTSPGETPIEYGQHVQEHANMWRTVGDLWDSWAQLKEHFDVFDRWNKWRSYGAYPDGDMLPLGKIGIRAERGDPRMSRLTKDEQITMMTLWSIFKSPLMFGGNLPDNDEFTLSLLTNKNVIEVLQKSENNRPLFQDEQKAAWVADDSGSDAKYLAVFNIADQKQIIRERALWSSGIITRETPNQSMPVELDISGIKKLYLVVDDGGDKIDWDHANWVNPIVSKGINEISLTELSLQKATAGWGEVQINRSVSGGELIINNQPYKKGFGVHSKSIIEINLQEEYKTFKSLVGLDFAGATQNIGATVEFLIFGENPSGPAPAEFMEIPVNLQDIGFTNNCEIKDLWSGESLGTFSGEFVPIIKNHGACLYKITASK